MLHRGFRLNVKWLLLVTVLALGAVLLAACGGDDVFEAPTDVATTTPRGESPTDTGGASPERPAVESVACGPLFTLEDVDDALGWSVGDDRPGPIRTARGEVCLHSLLRDGDVFVQIQPGDPADFEPGALVIGVSGEPVSGVGDAALWFGGEGSEAGGDVGVISVRRDTSLGAIHFRIFVGRPDLDSAAQLEVAKTLARAALPRFPGEVGYVNNLLLKEEAGQWTRGEGLVATLSLFAGEAEATQVLLNPELVDFDGTGVIRMAQEYLEDGPDAEAKKEIERLLERLILSRERLEAMAGIGPPTTARGLQAIFFDGARGADDCGTYFDPGGSCIEEVQFPELDEMFGEDKYTMWFPAESSQNKGGWTDKHLFWAVEAINQAAIVFEKTSEMPNVDIAFMSFDGPSLSWAAFGDDCFVSVNPPMQQAPEEDFKHFLIVAMSHCMIEEEQEEEEEEEPNEPDCEIDICLPSEFYWPLHGID